MQVDTLVKLLNIMGPYGSPEHCISSRQIALKWDGSDTHSDPSETTLRQVQRYMNELSSSIEGLPELIKFVEVDPSMTVKRPKSSDSDQLCKEHKPRKLRHYYLPHENLLKWFMSEQAALNLLLTGQIVGSALGDVSELGTNSVSKLAKDIITGHKSAKLSRIANSVRFLPDGIGRLSTQIETGLLQVMIDGIVRDRAVSFDYSTPTGSKSGRIVNPLGLVSKDGTIYLIASKGHNDVIIHYALQRASNASVESRHVRHIPPSFDLDKHIETTHRLSHQIGAEMALVLEVHEKALFHFKERPLTAEQEIKKIRGTELYRISAIVPETIALEPFLLSMKAAVTVLEPAKLRQTLATELKQMLANYTSSQ